MNTDSRNTIRIPTLLKPQEVAKMLRISMVGVYRLVESRSLPFYRVGRGLRFDEKDILTYLSVNRVESMRNENVYECTQN